jgi:hypothetical protein
MEVHPMTTATRKPKPNYDNSLSPEERQHVDALRHRGFAVIIWTPEELDGATPSKVEDRSIELGWDVIADLK